MCPIPVLNAKARKTALIKGKIENTLRCPNPRGSDLSGHFNRTCTERVELITNQLARREGVTEALKAADQMEWVRRMNNIRERAEEIVLSELVYC